MGFPSSFSIPDSQATDIEVAAAISAAVDPVTNALDEHEGNASNPHSVTKSQVNLANANNTSDADKPVSTAQQTALNLKANIASPTFTGTVAGITKTMVGLGSVDDTPDVSKPVSTGQQTAINALLLGTGVDGTITGTSGTWKDGSGNNLTTGSKWTVVANVLTFIADVELVDFTTGAMAFMVGADDTLFVPRIRCSGTFTGSASGSMRPGYAPNRVATIGAGGAQVSTGAIGNVANATTPRLVFISGGGFPAGGGGTASFVGGAYLTTAIVGNFNRVPITYADVYGTTAGGTGIGANGVNATSTAAPSFIELRELRGLRGGNGLGGSSGGNAVAAGTCHSGAGGTGGRGGGGFDIDANIVILASGFTINLSGEAATAGADAFTDNVGGIAGGGGGGSGGGGGRGTIGYLTSYTNNGATITLAGGAGGAGGLGKSGASNTTDTNRPGGVGGNGSAGLYAFGKL